MEDGAATAPIAFTVSPLVSCNTAELRNGWFTSVEVEPDL